MTAPDTPPPPPTPSSAPAAPAKKQRGCWFYGCLTAAILFVIILLTVLVTAWWVKRSMTGTEIEPTVLTQEEEVILEDKLEQLREGEDNLDEIRSEAKVEETGETLSWDEDDGVIRGPIHITEREINAMIGKNTELADRVKVKLRPDRIKIAANLPVPEDAPILGGKTLRFNLSTKVKVVEDQLVVEVESVGLGGMPIPNAWIMDIKNKNLAEEFFPDEKSRQTFMAGVEKLEVNEGEIVFVPAE